MSNNLREKMEDKAIGIRNGMILMRDKVKNKMEEIFSQEDGVGVIEVVLILVVLIGLVIIFKGQITELLENIFKEINSQSKEVY